MVNGKSENLEIKSNDEETKDDANNAGPGSNKADGL